jgi:hypothetical protein
VHGNEEKRLLGKKNAGIPYFLRDRGVLAPTEIRLNK